MEGSADPHDANQIGSRQAGEASNPPRSYAPLQILFLRRLAKLVHQRRQCQKLVEPADWHLTLINKALYSTYRDCLLLGLLAEVGLLLGEPQKQTAK